ncbi:hypothetical protein MPER_09782 [Moniliophthora perniciosa FA553]|nr:hypothetical protein MPER_09782 [Moniliophthora perniciosa FA553]
MIHFLDFASLFLFALVSLVFSAPIPDLQPRTITKRGYCGKATYFDVGMGNCGDTNTNTDMIVALATNTYNNGAHCNQWVKITDIIKNITQFATVKDSCPNCLDNDLDMSPSLFQAFNNGLDIGEFGINWEFV